LGIIPVISSAPARAAVADKCDGTSTQNTTKVTAQHGKIFYIDSGQGQNVDAAYVSYKVTNTSGSTAKSDIWVRLDSFVGGVVKLANTRDESQPIGAINANGNATAFFLLKASTSSTKAQSHVVRVYQGNPDLAGSEELYSCTYSFSKVSETIKAAANKVTDVTTVNTQKVGQTMTITVKGNTGIVGAGNSTDGRVIWLSPAARSTWPTQALRLESTSFDLFSNNGRNTSIATFPRTDTLIINTGISQAKYYYTAVYTFRIIGNAGAGVPISPLAQISSGTQMKHTDLTGTAITDGSVDVTPTTDLRVTKSLLGTTTYSSGTTTFTYSITLNNTAGASPVDVDLVTDSPDAQLSLVSGSATYNAIAIANPSALATDSTKLVFSGPFTVPNGESRVISYRMTKSDCTSGSYSVTNSATAQIGSLTIGSGASTYSQVAGTGTCGTTNVTPTVTDPTLTPSATTNPATEIATTGATLNASIDPEGTAGQSVSFLWGTSPTLATSTTTTLTASTNSTTSYAVSTTLSSLASGTTYYFRIKLGDILGDILSFTTYEVPATPTVATTSASNFENGTGSDNGKILVQFNGSVDPNQVANGVKVKFKYVIQDDQTQVEHSCVSTNIDAPSPGITTLPSSGFVQTETGESGGNATYGDAIYSGSFPTDAIFMNSSGVTTVALTPNKYYCYQIIGYYNSTTADWATPVEGAWVPFYASVKTAQTITFPTISTQSLGVDPITLGATASSGLAVSYTSNDETVCTVAYDSGSASWKVTVLTAGYCSITATQAGSDSVSEAEPVTIVFQVTVTLTYAGNTSNGGSVPSAYTGGGEVTLTSAGTMSKTGFTFGGWTIDGVSYLAGDKYLLTASKTATAIWKATVTYDPRSGTVSPTSAQFTLGGTGLTLPTPTRDGFVFTGWYTETTGGSNITSAYSPTASITLYAQWTAVYTVTFNANGGTGAASASTVTQASSGASVTLATKNTLALANSGFMGWGSATSAGTFYAAGDTSYVPTNNHSLYAQWITTGAAGSVLSTSATINGTSSLALTSPKFCYSTSNPGASFDVSSCTPVDASGTYAGYSLGLTGLTESTVYYYQITGQLSSTNYYGAVRTFTTSSASVTAPVPVTTAASSVTTTTATLNGTMETGGGSTTVIFEYCVSTTSGCTSSTMPDSPSTASGGSVTGAGAIVVSANVTGLTPGALYYFRVKGQNSDSTVLGEILSFTTTALTPWSITASNANYTIGGSVPTLTGTASPSGGLSGSLTCNAYASSDTGFLTPKTIDETLPAGTYVIRCTGATAAGYATPTNTTATLTVSAAAPTTYTITASAGSNGSISPSGSVTVNSGENQSFTITANSGYEINVLTVNSVSVTVVSTYTFNNVTSNHTISVTFKVITSGGPRNSGPSPTNNRNVKIIVQKISTGSSGASQGQTTTPATSTSSNGSSTGVTASSGGSIAALTNASTAPQSTNNGASVEAVNTNTTTRMVVDQNVPPSVSVERTADNKVNVQAINGWTGRVSVAVVDENDPTIIESFIEVSINPVPVAKVEVIVDKSIKDQVITFEPSASEIIRYEVLINGKKSCESVSASCAINQLIGPKSKLEVVAVGNDDTRSVSAPIKVAYQKPVVALVVNFAVGSSALTPSYRADLRALARVIKKEGFTRIQVEGHTDTQGTTIGYDNQTLSDARSRATRAYLLRLVPGLKFVTKANSFLQPAADNETPIGQFTNRRAEVKVW
jgi:uncharacterized repeat protein (TIGR02543 family)